MAHLTAILIVLTLTGQPVANALCVNWCNLPSERQHCGEAIAQTAPKTSLASSRCGVPVSAGSFLREEGRSALCTAAVETALDPDLLRPVSPPPYLLDSVFRI